MFTDPAFLVAATRAGAPHLAGRRTLTDSLPAAEATADECGGKVYALEPIEPAPYAPVAAVTHVAVDGIVLGSVA